MLHSSTRSHVERELQHLELLLTEFGARSYGSHSTWRQEIQAFMDEMSSEDNGTSRRS